MKPMVAAFYWLPDGITVPELVRRVGSPYEQSELTLCPSITYKLADGSSVHAYVHDGTKIDHIIHSSGVAWSQLYPVPSLIRLQLEPNRALQRTAAGSTSVLYPVFDLANFCH